MATSKCPPEYLTIPPSIEIWMMDRERTNAYRYYGEELQEENWHSQLESWAHDIGRIVILGFKHDIAAYDVDGKWIGWGP